MSQTPPAVTLESQGVKLVLSASADLDRFVTNANAKARIKGLDDGVNPGIVDPTKLRAMVTALAAQPEAVRAALTGHELIINDTGFGVLAVEPVRADAFGPAYRITIERMAGTHVLAHANPVMDPARAETQSAAGKAATEAAIAAVKAAEAAKSGDLGDIRWRRAQAARGWMIAAQSWRDAAPGNAAAAAAFETARAAASAYDMPSGGRI